MPCYHAILTIDMAPIVVLSVRDSFKLSENGERASFPPEGLVCCLVSEEGYDSSSLCWCRSRGHIWAPSPVSGVCGSGSICIHLADRPSFIVPFPDHVL